MGSRVERRSVSLDRDSIDKGTVSTERPWHKAQSLATQEDNERKTAAIKHHNEISQDKPAGERPKVDEQYLEKLDKIFRPEQKTRSGCDFVIIWAVVLNPGVFEAKQENFRLPKVSYSIRRGRENKKTSGEPWGSAALDQVHTSAWQETQSIGITY